MPLRHQGIESRVWNDCWLKWNLCKSPQIIRCHLIYFGNWCIEGTVKTCPKQGCLANFKALGTPEYILRGNSLPSSQYYTMFVNRSLDACFCFQYITKLRREESRWKQPVYIYFSLVSFLLFFKVLFPPSFNLNWAPCTHVELETRVDTQNQTI